MHKFWSWLGLNLGKHWIAVVLVGGCLTLGLGYGTTKLKFSTDQSNYLNKTDQVYKDNVAYQGLFGGEAMITLVTMDPGHTVAELFTRNGITQWTNLANEIDASHKVLNVVTPLTALQWNDNLVKGPKGDVTQSVAGKILAADLTRDTSKAGQDAPRRIGVRDDRPHQRDTGRAAHDRQSAIPRLLALRQSSAERPEAHPGAPPRDLSRRPSRAGRRAAAR